MPNDYRLIDGTPIKCWPCQTSDALCIDQRPYKKGMVLSRVDGVYVPGDKTTFDCPVFGLRYTFFQQLTLLRKIATLFGKIYVVAHPLAIIDEFNYKQLIMPFCTKILYLK